MFLLASFTKPLTATLVMQQVERGAISLEVPVAEYIPGFDQNGKGTVTTRHLLSHSSGLPGRIDDHFETYDELIELLCKQGPEFEPGTKSNYCNVGFTVAVELLRRATGKELNELGREQLFGPLRMSRTQMMRGDGWQNDLVPIFDDDLKVIDDMSPPAADWPVLGAAGACSSAGDIAVLCQMMLNGGAYGDVRVLSPVTVQRMIEPQFPWWDSPERLTGTAVERQQALSKGLGWMVRGPSHYRGSDVMSPRAFFQGGTWGMRAIADPEYDMLTVFFTSFTNSVHHDIHHVFGTMAFAAVTEL